MGSFFGEMGPPKKVTGASTGAGTWRRTPRPANIWDKAANLLQTSGHSPAVWNDATMGVTSSDN